MHLIDVLAQDHALLRSAFRAVELHLGPARGCGWEDRVRLDPAKFHEDLDGLLRALRAHECLEEKVAARWRMTSASGVPLKSLLLARHDCIDSLMRLCAIAAALIVDGHVHATRTILSRLRDELMEHIEEEERALFPPLLSREKARV